MKKILLISGKAESGKDYTGGIIKDILEEQNQSVLVMHYADILKYYCKQFFNWNGNKDEKGRSLLQHVGQTVRAKDENYWTNQICNVINLFQNDFDYFIIPDARFPNEIEIPIKEFKKENVITIRIIRDNFQNRLTKEQRQEISEVALDNRMDLFDLIIHNPGMHEDYVNIIKKEIINKIKED